MFTDIDKNNNVKKGYLLHGHKHETDCRWQNEIPNIQFPSDWEVRIIPPFGGAVVRFIAIKGDREVSVYLDCYDNLGVCGQPYWEMYPNEKGYADRFLMNDTDGLLESIEKSLEYKEE